MIDRTAVLWDGKVLPGDQYSAGNHIESDEQAPRLLDDNELMKKLNAMEAAVQRTLQAMLVMS